MRIVHLIDDARPVGGAQTYLRRLCAGTAPAGWEHLVVAGVPASEPPDGAEQRASTGSAEGDAALALGASPDLVLLHTVDPPGVVQALLGRVPTYLYEHDYRHLSPGNLRFFQRSEEFCDGGFGLRCLVKPYTERCNNRRPDRVLSSIDRVRRWRPLLGRLDGVLCASDFAARLVASFAPGTKVSVVGYPVDVPAASVPAAAGRADVLYVGRTSPVKGIHHLIDAFARLEPERRGCRLLVAAGPDLEEVRVRARAARVEGAVELLGWLDEGGLAEAYRRARVLAAPSVWPEPFLMAGPEALAHGVPVVASDVGGVSSWLDPSRGALVPPGDAAALAGALARYLDDPAAADAAGAAGRAFVAAELGMDGHLARLVPALGGAR